MKKEEGFGGLVTILASFGTPLEDSLDLWYEPRSKLYASILLDLKFCPIFFLNKLVGVDEFHKVNKFIDP